MSEVRVRVAAEPCSECPWVGRFKFVHLRAIRRDVLDREGVFICHLSQAEPGDRQVADDQAEGACICAGWRERLPGDAPPMLLVAEALGLMREVEVK